MGYRFYAHNLHRFYTCDWPIEHLARPTPPVMVLQPADADTAPRTVCG